MYLTIYTWAFGIQIYYHNSSPLSSFSLSSKYGSSSQSSLISLSQHFVRETAAKGLDSVVSLQRASELVCNLILVACFNFNDILACEIEYSGPVYRVGEIDACGSIYEVEVVEPVSTEIYFESRPGDPSEDIHGRHVAMPRQFALGDILL